MSSETVLATQAATDGQEPGPITGKRQASGRLVRRFPSDLVAVGQLWPCSSSGPAVSRGVSLAI